MLDGAYWMKGCSSLGLLRYALLLGVAGDSGRTETLLIDVKARRPPPPRLPRLLDAKMPADNAQRVVAGLPARFRPSSAAACWPAGCCAGPW